MRGNIIWGLAFIIVGLLFVADNYGVIDVRIADLWPLILVFIGLEMIFEKKRKIKVNDSANEGRE